MTTILNNIVRAAVLPFTKLSVIFALIMFWLLISLASLAGMWGAWLAVIIVPALFRYMTNLVETVGRDLEPQPPGADESRTSSLLGKTRHGRGRPLSRFALILASQRAEVRRVPCVVGSYRPVTQLPPSYRPVTALLPPRHSPMRAPPAGAEWWRTGMRVQLHCADVSHRGSVGHVGPPGERELQSGWSGAWKVGWSIEWGIGA